MTNRRSLSRRKILWAVATTGAAASTGGGTAALLHDSEQANGALTAGTVDLETDPSWTGSLGSVSLDGSGNETIELEISSNPSYVWFRINCKECIEIEKALFVRYSLDKDGDGSYEQDITDGFISLAEARERYGEGYNLGTLDPDQEWSFQIEWELRESIEETEIPFIFEFYATQTRHLMNTDTVSLPWDECGPCDSQTTSLPAISWVSFCGSAVGTDFHSFTPQRSDDDRTLLLDTEEYTILDSVDTIAIKYGANIDVFERSGYDGSWPSSLTVGDGDTYTKGDGNVYTNDAGDERRNNSFCSGGTGCKYEFSDVWECTGGDS
jgi:predicted ribosomally synthesized peptide with SipW-like signal peptide